MLIVVGPVKNKNLPRNMTFTQIDNPYAAAVLGPGQEISLARRKSHVSHRTTLFTWSRGCERCDEGVRARHCQVRNVEYGDAGGLCPDREVSTVAREARSEASSAEN